MPSSKRGKAIKSSDQMSSLGRKVKKVKRNGDQSEKHQELKQLAEQLRELLKEYQSDQEDLLKKFEADRCDLVNAYQKNRANLIEQARVISSQALAGWEKEISPNDLAILQGFNQPKAPSTRSASKSPDRKSNRTSCTNDELNSISQMKDRTVSKLSGIDIDKLYLKEQHKMGNVLQLRSSALEELKEACYSSLLKAISNYGYPKHSEKEDLKAEIIKGLLGVVIFYLKTNLNIEGDRLKFLLNTEFEIQLKHLRKTVKPDILIGGRKGDKEIYYLAVVESKRFTCEEGIKQQAIYMSKALWKHNGDNKPVYGLCCNGTHYNLIKFDPKDKTGENISEEDFELTEVFRFLFVEIAKYKKDWIKNYSKIVEILYAILMEKLEM